MHAAALDVTNQRAVNYRFFCLPFAVRLRVVLDLGLIEDGDEAKDFMVVFSQCVNRSAARGDLEALGHRVAWESERSP